MPPPDDTKLPHDFLRRLDAGEFDGRFSKEIGKLSKEQLEELALILAERDGKGRLHRRHR